MGIGDTEWYEKAVMELDSALNKWLDSVPEHRKSILSIAVFIVDIPQTVKWENQNDASIFFSQSAILYSAYYWVQIQIHRKFIPRPGHTSSMLSFPSLTICTNAARSCIRIGETYHKKQGSPLYPNILVSLIRGRRVELSESGTLDVFVQLGCSPCFKSCQVSSTESKL